MLELMLDELGPIRESLLGEELKPLGDPGRVGRVMAVGQGVAYKRYDEPLESEHHLDALINWRRSLDAPDRLKLDSFCAWPRRRVFAKGKTVGFLMKQAPARFWMNMLGAPHLLELQHLIYADQAERLGLPVPSELERLQIISSFAEAVGFFASHAIVYPDVSEKNLLWAGDGSGAIFILDCDNVVIPGITKPETLTISENWHDGRTEIDEYTDRYTLGAIYYRVFYKLALPLPKDRTQLFVPESSTAPASLELLLHRAVGQPEGRPTPQEWVDAIALVRSTPQDFQVKRGEHANRAPRGNLAKLGMIMGALVILALSSIEATRLPHLFRDSTKPAHSQPEHKPTISSPNLPSVSSTPSSALTGPETLLDKLIDELVIGDCVNFAYTLSYSLPSSPKIVSCGAAQATFRVMRFDYVIDTANTNAFSYCKSHADYVFWQSGGGRGICAARAFRVGQCSYGDDRAAIYQISAVPCDTPPSAKYPKVLKISAVRTGETDACATDNKGNLYHLTKEKISICADLVSR